MKVWVQLGENGQASRIFKNQKEMFFECPAGKEASMERSIAVGQIRKAIWNRQNGICTRCPAIFTYAGMHLHEKLSRGRGGEISLENSEGLCAPCHIGVRGAHGARRPQFAKRTGER